jgi:iron complex transport system ATP-binding protein
MSLALRLSGVGLVRDGVTILDGVDWTVAPHERWIVLGPNGSGKTTLMRVAGLYLHPSRGASRSSVSAWGGSTSAGSARASGS